MYALLNSSLQKFNTGCHADCELIKWNLTLYQDASDKKPTAYKLHCVYGLPGQGTIGLTGNEKEIEMDGKWKIVKGTAANANAIVINYTMATQTI